MRSNQEADDLHLRTNNAFIQRLHELYRYYLTVPKIQNVLRDFWSLFVLLLDIFKELFLKQYIAVTLLFLSGCIGVAVVIASTDSSRFIVLIYCVSFFICSIISLACNRGAVLYLFQIGPQQLEQQYLLEQRMQRRRRRRGRHEADYLERDYERPEGEAAQTSSGIFKEQTYDSKGPIRHTFQARLAAEAIQFFGPPLQIFGADSYIIVDSSSETIAPDYQATGRTSKTFETSIEVYHSNLFRPLNASIENFSSAKPVGLEKSKSVQMGGFASGSNLQCVDD